MLIIKLRSANTAETRQYKTATKALLVLIPLLGISYIMLLHGPEDEVGGQMITILQAIFIPTQVGLYFMQLIRVITMRLMLLQHSLANGSEKKL